MDICILVAAHKPCWVPEDGMYLPVHVGKYGKESIGFIGDDTGDQISAKNAAYSELTGLYWSWKHIDADYIGLVHYRRYFTCHRLSARITKGKERRVLRADDARRLLRGYDVILPRKRHYWIETVRSQYAHAHNPDDLRLAEQVLCEMDPAYEDAFHTVMNRTCAHLCNMFVMRKPCFRTYCSWLFPLLERIEYRMQLEHSGKPDARVFGYLSERLLDVWLEKNPIRYRELPVLFMESRNWAAKISAFVLRKLNAGDSLPARIFNRLCRTSKLPIPPGRNRHKARPAPLG